MRKNSTVDHYALSIVSHMGQKSNNSDGKFMKRKHERMLKIRMWCMHTSAHECKKKNVLAH